jgi:hypothetical protein
VLFYPRESQFESKPAAEQRAAAVPRGGRVLIRSRNFPNPTAKRRWGFLFLTTNEHRAAKLDGWIIGLLDYWAAERTRSSINPFIH